MQCLKEAAVQMLCNFIEIALRHGCSLVNMLHILRTNFSQEHLSAAASVYSFHWSVKFSFRMINGTREEIEFSCTNCFRSIVLLVFVLATALCKFRFRPLRNKMINLVLVIKYHFDFRLQFDINKKCIFQRFTEILLNNGKWNYMTQLSTKWSTALGKRMSSINVRSV